MTKSRKEKIQNRLSELTGGEAITEAVKKEIAELIKELDRIIGNQA